MSKTFLHVLSAILCISISACTTLRAVPDWRASSPAGATGQNQGLSVDDEVLVTTVEGNQTRLIILSIEPDALVGYSHQHGYPDRVDQPIRIKFDDIAKVERSETSWLRTSLAIAGASLVYLISMLSQLHVGL